MLIVQTLANVVHATGGDEPHLRALSKNTSSTPHVAPGCSWFHFLLFDTTTDLDTCLRDADWNQTKPVQLRAGMDGLALWPTPPQTQVMSPSSASTSAE